MTKERKLKRSTLIGIGVIGILLIAAVGMGAMYMLRSRTATIEGRANPIDLDSYSSLIYLMEGATVEEDVVITNSANTTIAIGVDELMTPSGLVTISYYDNADVELSVDNETGYPYFTIGALGSYTLTIEYVGETGLLDDQYTVDFDFILLGDDIFENWSP